MVHVTAFYIGSAGDLGKVCAFLTSGRLQLTFIRRQSPQDQNVWQDLGRMLGRPDVVTATIRAGR